MIIVCLVLVVAAFVVIGAALALAELTLVNIALGLGGLAAVLLAVEFVRNRKVLLGQGRAESLLDHQSAGRPGAVAGQVRTDDVGKASVPPLGTAAALGEVVAPTTSVDSPPETVQEDEERTVVAGFSVPAPVSEPVREAAIPPPAEAPDIEKSDPPREEQPHGSTELDNPSAEDDTPTVPAAHEDTDDVVESASTPEPEDREAPMAGDADSVDADDPADESPPTEAVTDLPHSDSDSDDSAARHTPDLEATEALPILAEELHGSTAVGSDNQAAGSEETEDSSAETPTVEPVRDAATDNGKPENSALADTTEDSDSPSTAGSDDSASAATTESSSGDEAATDSDDHDASPNTADSAGDAADNANPDTEETAAITFREPAEWNPPSALPSWEQYENRNVSAAAIAELAARWTPTGSDLDTDAAASETEPAQIGSDEDHSTDAGDGSAPANPPDGSTAAAADDSTP